MTKKEILDLWYSDHEVQSTEEAILVFAESVLRADRERLAQLECIYCLDYIKKASPSAAPAEYIESANEWIHVYRDSGGIVRLRNRCRGSAIRNLPIFDMEQEEE